MGSPRQPHGARRDGPYPDMHHIPLRMVRVGRVPQTAGRNRGMALAFDRDPDVSPAVRPVWENRSNYRSDIPDRSRIPTMTRIIRINYCDECPKLRHGCGEPLRCLASKEEWNGYEVSRRFKITDPFPFIPDWCPLEQDGPDRRPPEISKSNER